MTATIDTAKIEEKPWLSNAAALMCFAIAALMLITSLQPNKVAAKNATFAGSPIQLNLDNGQAPAPKMFKAKVH